MVKISCDNFLVTAEGFFFSAAHAAWVAELRSVSRLIVVVWKKLEAQALRGYAPTELIMTYATGPCRMMPLIGCVCHAG